eukprot:TRINITY_DN9948_c0_g1_i2.p1 TRINITY_DN9948_c0_g1~~TRINITY_DN9948_c0_g1_i2.p1  ORF type:complete len:216 (+),score=31.12 TRINITY_DN9948_c0_g1_i2:203-850(+)
MGNKLASQIDNQQKISNQQQYSSSSEKKITVSNTTFTNLLQKINSQVIGKESISQNDMKQLQLIHKQHENNYVVNGAHRNYNVNFGTKNSLLFKISEDNQKSQLNYQQKPISNTPQKYKITRPSRLSQTIIQKPVLKTQEVENIHQIPFCNGGGQNGVQVSTRIKKTLSQLNFRKNQTLNEVSNNSRSSSNVRQARQKKQFSEYRNLEQYSRLTY